MHSIWKEIIINKKICDTKFVSVAVKFVSFILTSVTYAMFIYV